MQGAAALICQPKGKLHCLYINILALLSPKDVHVLADDGCVPLGISFPTEYISCSKVFKGIKLSLRTFNVLQSC